MEIINVSKSNIEIFSEVLIEAAKWLDSIGQTMWKIENLTPYELLKKYDINEMKLCYDNGNLIGAYVLQWYDPLFWKELEKYECGILHKLAISREYSKMGYGRKIIESAEELCKKQGVNSLRLNCGTFRPRLRKFYEGAGFKMVDRVFIDNRDQVRYTKILDEDYKLNLRKETKHFIINYTEADKLCIEKISEVLENNYNRITTNLNQQIDEKVIIEIHHDIKKLHNALGLLDAPDWIRGGLGKGKIIIASPLNLPPGSDFNNVLNTAVHEFVHIIVNRINKNIPRWLDEGIACYEAKDNDENWIRKTVKNGLMDNTFPVFKELDTGEDFDMFFKRDGYQYSYTIAEFIIKEFGYNKLYNLIKAPDDFTGIFGIKEKQIENEWIEYIRKNYIQ